MRLIDAEPIEAWMSDYENSEPYGLDAVKLERMIREAPTIEPKQEWIPCSERLPEEVRASYWICTDDGYQCQCRWTNVNPFWSDLTTDWHWNPYEAPRYSEVVAWMPLPEPWKGAEDV